MSHVSLRLSHVSLRMSHGSLPCELTTVQTSENVCSECLELVYKVGEIGDYRGAGPGHICRTSEQERSVCFYVGVKQ